MKVIDLRVSEQRTDKNIWALERKATGGKKKLHNRELRNLYFSPTITRLNKSRRYKLTGHVDLLGTGFKAVTP
jgi:hypothetical protein